MVLTPQAIIERIIKVLEEERTKVKERSKAVTTYDFKSYYDGFDDAILIAIDRIKQIRIESGIDSVWRGH